MGGRVGRTVGSSVDGLVGSLVVRSSVGCTVGSSVGGSVGFPVVGSRVGCAVGSSVGKVVGNRGNTIELFLHQFRNLF